MVRERSVSYLDENRAAYEEFLGGREKFDEYLANMRRDKVRFFPVLYFIPGGSTELFGSVSDSSSSLHPLKTWGDEMTLCGACNAFECVINGKAPIPSRFSWFAPGSRIALLSVITSEAGNWYLQYWPRQDEDEEGEAKGKKEIFIGYTYPLHYDAVAGEGIEDTPLTPQ